MPVRIASLQRKKHFQQLRQESRVWRCPHFRIHFSFVGGDEAGVSYTAKASSSPAPPHASLLRGLITSKKMAKKAVVRNRIRRRIKEAMHVTFSPMPLTTDLHMVIIPTLACYDDSFETLTRAFAKAATYIAAQEASGHTKDNSSFKPRRHKN
ncbi:ribonuclease P protein component [Candidatus Hepatobacter penaei]|uniref:ribonuclease P protein component n=1 Tax=Candidatus Hepatobacter penaei TaxID=1274402 RepID=UPI001FE0891B|nr:ribonuclease P protein component [Candidatus Hepatobacter penaei]